MIEFPEDEYNSFNELKLNAHKLFRNLDKTKINKTTLIYFECIEEYIKKYENIRLKLINDYIRDLKNERNIKRI